MDNEFSHSDNEMNLCASPAPKKPSRIPPLISRSLLSNKRLGGAFTSYVRRRGEPDGKTSSSESTKASTVDTKPKKTNVLTRPGGNVSDQAFTPSPPVVLQSENTSMAMSLAHQSRIRNLYSQSEGKPEHRPGSSSSASSITDWDSGLNTVLRRQHQSQNQSKMSHMNVARTKPLVDLSMFANLGNGIFENSSDSELEKMEAKLFNTRSKMAYKKCRNIISTLDRLRCRSEMSSGQTALPQNPRKTITLPSEETLPSNERLLYFSPNDKDGAAKVSLTI